MQSDFGRIPVGTQNQHGLIRRQDQCFLAIPSPEFQSIPLAESGLVSASLREELRESALPHERQGKRKRRALDNSVSRTAHEVCACLHLSSVAQVHTCMLLLTKVGSRASNGRVKPTALKPTARPCLRVPSTSSGPGDVVVQLHAGPVRWRLVT